MPLQKLLQNLATSQNLQHRNPNHKPTSRNDKSKLQHPNESKPRVQTTSPQLNSQRHEAALAKDPNSRRAFGSVFQAATAPSSRIMCKSNADQWLPCEQGDKQEEHVNLIKSRPTERVDRVAMRIGGQCWSRRLLVIILIELIALCQTVGFFSSF